MSESDIIELLLSEIGDLAYLILTLSLAVSGGLTGLLIQIAIHNKKKDVENLDLKGVSLLVLCFLFQSVSILFGYISKASLLTYIAFYQNRKLEKNVLLGDQKNFEFIQNTQIFSLAQFLLFVFGIFLVFIFIIINLELINGHRIEYKNSEEAGETSTT